MIVVLMIGFGFLGLVIPTASVMALEHHGAIAGTASALMGTMQMVTGAVVIALMGLVMDGGAQGRCWGRRRRGAADVGAGGGLAARGGRGARLRRRLQRLARRSSAG